MILHKIVDHLSFTTKNFLAYTSIHQRSFKVLLLCPIASSPTLGRFVIHSIPDFALDAHIISINKICICYPIKIKYNSEQGKILIAKSINNMLIYICFLEFKTLKNCHLHYKSSKSRRFSIRFYQRQKLGSLLSLPKA